jgi:hypothetical protein
MSEHIKLEERQRDEDLRGPLLHIILQNIAAFHPDRNKCPREILIENLEIDFQHNDTNTLIAIAGVIVELHSIIADLPGKATPEVLWATNHEPPKV